MIEAKIVFKKGKKLKEEYKEFMSDLISISKGEEVLKRKGDSSKWREHESEKYYQIVAKFSVKELRLLGEKYSKNIYVYGDASYGRRRLP